MEEWKSPKEAQVVNSYQGAFGPPTLGHYQAMLAAANATLAANPGKNVLMLFMPTAESSSKKHLALTKGERIRALNIFCEKLKTQISEPDRNRIIFQASTLEYSIFDTLKSSATIHTLKSLKYFFPTASIQLTMGLDNLYDLPFWENIAAYPEYTQKIYIAKRDPTPEDLAKTLPASDLGLDIGDVRFNKFASWDFGKVQGDVETMRAETLVDSGGALCLKTKMSCVGGPLKSIKYEFLDAKISPTSSSMLRAMLKQYYDRKNEATYKNLEQLTGYANHVKFDAAAVDAAKDPWFAGYALSGHLVNQSDITKQDSEYDKAFPAGQGGGSRRRKSKGNRRTRRR